MPYLISFSYSLTFFPSIYSYKMKWDFVPRAAIRHEDHGVWRNLEEVAISSTK